MESGLVTANDKAQFQEQIASHIDRVMEGGAPEGVSPFTELFYENSPLDELRGYRLQDLFGISFSWWNFIQKRKPKSPSIRVFNPSFEEDGWLCPHTVVAVLQEDMPFLVDSIRIEMNRRDIDIHAVKSVIFDVERDAKGNLKRFIGRPSAKKKAKSVKSEALIFLEVGLHTQPKAMDDIHQSLQSVLRELETAVIDYEPMREQLQVVSASLEYAKQSEYVPNIKEAQDFLHWMDHNHFTYLGYVEYHFEGEGDERVLAELPEKRLGLFKSIGNKAASVLESDFNEGMTRFHLSPKPISCAKSSMRSRIHRHAYSDYVVVKLYNSGGKVMGEGRFLGLYTSPVYSERPEQIPLVRVKIANILERSNKDLGSHDGKALRQVLDSFPRDELLQSSEAELFSTAMSVAAINERSLVRLYMRRDHYRKFISATVYVPRDRYNTQVRRRIEALIGDSVNAKEYESSTRFSESILARCHMVFRVDPNEMINFDVNELQSQVVELTRTWEDVLRSALCDAEGEERGVTLYDQFGEGFSAGYRETFDARTAVQDIGFIEQLDQAHQITMSFYRPVGADSDSVKFKVFHEGVPLELSDVIPLLENMGLRVIGEHPYTIRSGKTRFWLHDFDLKYDVGGDIDVADVRSGFQEAFEAIWLKRCDSDKFNRLVLGAKLSWREVSVLRAYAVYMKQTAFNFSDAYMADTLSNHLHITRDLVDLFTLSFDPSKQTKTTDDKVSALKEKILSSLDEVKNLNEDQIIRRYLDMMSATLRTNFYQVDEQGAEKPYTSFKFQPKAIADIPEPKPEYEIFVYSPRMEGVHLRGAKVARGGLRWSDRLQDYRTEVLGLVKAQQVKNAVIVPNGAKGGFVGKQLPHPSDRQAFIAEGIECYKTFIRGLLDVTDNIVGGDIVPPKNVVRKDEDDPYLVVAADKGTATFSDIANEISAEYGHWLGDAFASGGSQGYDHKGMGITAKGAWVSVQRHFREKGVDVQKEDFTVIGVGDMAGDVFGNGMLLSEHICLTAAFNHLHIFIDPTPDSAKSFVERQRLFNSTSAGWGDYDKALISKGGGVFDRSAKSIKISPEMQKCFDIQEKQMTPNQLINALLKAPVDLIWNGGIGTYIKAASETHGNVGDKANDSLRVNGSELRCKVFGEGGNLGMTQLGRIEFSLNGGACNTDFIDNSAGVDCSDHEVNIKILLDDVVDNGDMTQKQRNKLLADMTDEVSDLVLHNNYKQSQAISVCQHLSKNRVNEYRRFMNYMEETGRLNRALEFLPSDEQVVERKQKGLSLTRPELSVLISYAKVMLKELLDDPELTDDEYVAKAVESAFPQKLRKKYADKMYSHRLRSEIIATQVANDMVNHMGINFYRRLVEGTGAGPVAIAKAYITARDIQESHDYFADVEAFDHKIPSEVQYHLLSIKQRRMRRTCRWILRNRRGELDPHKEVKVLAESVKTVEQNIAGMLKGSAKEAWQSQYENYISQGISESVAAESALPILLFHGMGITDAARSAGADPLVIAEIYAILGDTLSLHWVASEITKANVDSYWQAMAREAYMDDLEAQIRSLAISIVRFHSDGRSIQETVEKWLVQHDLLVTRWQSMVKELQGTSATDYAMFAVALRELLDLAQASQHCQSLDDDSTACILGGD